MSTAELASLLLGLGTAADVVEAIDDPRLRQQRGWDLSGWRYDLVPWGVRFSSRDERDGDEAEVLALLDVYSGARGRPSGPFRWTPSTTVLMLG